MLRFDFWFHLLQNLGTVIEFNRIFESLELLESKQGASLKMIKVESREFQARRHNLRQTEQSVALQALFCSHLHLSSGN